MKRVISCVLLMLVLTSNAFALEVPTDTVVQNLNGSQQAIKTFTVSPEQDPAALIEEPFELEGYLYTFADIVKSENPVEEKRIHTEVITVETTKDDLALILEQLKPTIEYDDGRFQGIDIVSWRATAEFVSKYFTKGRMAVVEGRLQIRDWTDKEGGKRRSAEVIADNVYFGDSKPKDGGEEDDVPAYTGAPDSFAVPDGFTPDFGGESGEMPF